LARPFEPNSTLARCTLCLQIRLRAASVDGRSDVSENEDEIANANARKKPNSRSDHPDMENDVAMVGIAMRIENDKGGM
jgi:hypothetical protein